MNKTNLTVVELFKEKKIEVFEFMLLR